MFELARYINSQAVYRELSSQILIMTALTLILFFGYFVSLGSCLRHSRDSTNDTGDSISSYGMIMTMIVSSYEKRDVEKYDYVPTKKDPNDKKYEEVASRAIKKFDGDKCPRKIEKIVKVETSGIAVWEYHMTVKMCGFKEGCDTDTHVCGECMLDIWEQTWDNFTDVVQIICPTIPKCNYENPNYTSDEDFKFLRW